MWSSLAGWFGGRRQPCGDLKEQSLSLYSFPPLGHCVFRLEVLVRIKCGYKNISEKEHVAFERSLKSLSLGRIHSFYSPAWCLPPGMNTQSMVCVEIALWEPLSCAHLNFNLYGRKRKEGSLSACYALCSPMQLSSDE